ncbi:MAG TPA: bacillithiol biosynthesis deacetylase BshB1 [Planctomycetes bacterium]|nr:bacillithiol biosynthesis deacetylase BshB1 [Planctomycetota bacterium]
MSKTSILAFGAHPDDVELNAGGLMALTSARGERTVICHLTRGEMGTRGTPETREQEARAAAKTLGVSELEFLGQPDGWIEESEAAKRRLVTVLRRHRPSLVLAPYWSDLHPDHATTGALVRKAAFLSGLARIDDGLAPWRPARVLYYMSHDPIPADLVVDISSVFETKRAAALCYRSQFHDPDSTEPETFISRSDFWDFWEGRASWWGHFVGVRYGEGYFADGPIPTRNPVEIFQGFGKYKNADPEEGE